MIASIPFPDVSPALFSVDIPLWQFSLAGMDFSLGGFELALRWYALAYIAGILLASWIRNPVIGFCPLALGSMKCCLMTPLLFWWRLSRR